MKKDLLKGKKVLVVDDEADVIETLEDLLDMCHIVCAYTYEDAREILERESFDLAILDIRGVDGYKLLEITADKRIPAVMLTANALSVEDTIRSFEGGAASYVPKEEMIHIAEFLNDILKAQKEGQPLWNRWLKRLGPFYEKKFGPEWQKTNPIFWKTFKKDP